MTNFAFLWAAREGNAQSKKWEATFFLRYVKKDKMADGTPRRLCVSHSPFNGADFWKEGDGSFQVVGRTHLEVDLEQTQNYYVEYLALYLRRMII